MSGAMVASPALGLELGPFWEALEQRFGVEVPLPRRPSLLHQVDAVLGRWSVPAVVTALRTGGTVCESIADIVVPHETRFFREAPHFEFLQNSLIPRWQAEASAGRRERRLRVWSAACSTGEEPYSLAMVLHERLIGDGWTVDLLASDLSRTCLHRAERGIWPAERATAVGEERRRRYLLKGSGPYEGQVSVAPTLKSLVRFRQHNLMNSLDEGATRFDLIMCRNVLFYFTDRHKKLAVANLTRQLTTGGYLFTGHNESLSLLVDDLEPVGPSIYRPGRSK